MSEHSLIDINADELDKECIRLPGLVLKYAVAVADARLAVDEAKAQLELAEAELGQAIRAEPDKYGVDKITDKVVEATIVTRLRYKKALAELHTKKHELEKHQAVLSALDHKKRSVTLLVDLHGMGYFASPRISAAGREAVEEMTKKAVRRRSRED